MRALNTLREILENEFKGVYALKVIDVLKHPQLAEEDKITIEKVLLLKDKDTITVGKPYVKDAKIELEVVSHKRDKKIIVYKMRPKKRQEEKWVIDKNLQELW